MGIQVVYLMSDTRLQALNIIQSSRNETEVINVKAIREILAEAAELGNGLIMKNQVLQKDNEQLLSRINARNAEMEDLYTELVSYKVSLQNAQILVYFMIISSQSLKFNLIH